jgi:DNA invertase Pin-like site-specific DNA recombinase
MIKNLYIGYYRVSREEQGKSGLGLQSQKRAVTDYVNGNGILIG